MTKAKGTRRRAKAAGGGDGGEEKEATLVQVPEGFSPSAANAFNVRMNGGVIEHQPAESDDARSYRESGSTLVEIPRLDTTVIDPVLGKIYPSDQPVKVSYGLAVTLGLLNANPNNPPGAMRQQSLVTEPQTEGGATAEDNGHGGTGRESGYEQPAVDLASQPVTLDEIDEAASARGLDSETVGAARQQEIDARREAIRP
jgi:hypothetical protein